MKPGVDRIAEAFARARAERRAALVTYVMCGDPDFAGSLEFAQACADGGADLIELGIPFSDPIADGPVIQRAGERALASGTTLRDAFRAAEVLSAKLQPPLVVMTYANPVFSLGETAFAQACARSGIAGAIIPDLPGEERGALAKACAETGTAFASFLSPVTTPQRRAHSLRSATGFVYFVSVTGVTGARRDLPPELPAQLQAARAEASTPIVVGFGVSSPESAAALGRHAAGVVVGSAIVSLGAQPGPIAGRAIAIRHFVQSLRRALESKES